MDWFEFLDLSMIFEASFSNDSWNFWKAESRIPQIPSRQPIWTAHLATHGGSLQRSKGAMVKVGDTHGGWWSFYWEGT